MNKSKLYPQALTKRNYYLRFWANRKKFRPNRTKNEKIDLTDAKCKNTYDSFNIESPERKDKKERVVGRICVKNNTQRVVTSDYRFGYLNVGAIVG